MNYMSCKMLVNDPSVELSNNLTNVREGRFKIVDTLTNEEYEILDAIDLMNGTPEYYGLEVPVHEGDYVSDADYQVV